MSTNCANSNEPVSFEALELLQDGLRLLDQQEVPDEIGAHVDLAISRLKAHLSKEVRCS
jgi:hypothetical protein